MPGHGPQFDEFRAPARSPHGGTEYDEGFTRNPGKTSEHGELSDEDYRRMAAVSKHGDLWDEFNWKTMPTSHGQSFDSDFAHPDALRNGEHGTWTDVFRGGTQVRYLDQGHNVEGIVIRCTPTHAVVQQRYTENQGGKRRELSEVSLGQIVEWRYANQQSDGKRRPVATPGFTPADVPDRLDSPSLAARGGDRTGGPDVSDSKVLNKTEDLDDELIEKAFTELAGYATVSPEILSEVEAIAKGGKRGSATTGTAATHAHITTAPRHPNGKIDHGTARQILTQRSATFRAGVAANREKTLPKVNHGGFKCSGCGHSSFRVHPVAHPGGGVNKKVAMHGCASCGMMHPHHVGKAELVDVDVVKTVDTSETALLPAGGQDTVGKVGHRSGCPRGGSSPCGGDEAGKCSTCGASVRDHEATGKQHDPLLEVRKLARVAG